MADPERVAAATEYLGKLIAQAEQAAEAAVQELADAAVRILNQEAVTAAAVDPGDFESLPQEWGQQVDAHMVPVVADSFQEGVLQAVVQLPVATEAQRNAVPEDDWQRVINPLVEGQMADARMQFAAVGPEATLRVQQALLEGQAAGEGVDALTERVHSAAMLSEARARVIARTEAVRASNAGAFQQAMMLSRFLPVTKEWINTSDSRTRKTHVAAGGQEVSLTEGFDVGGSFLQFPGDPAGPAAETVNCRCTLIFNEVEASAKPNPGLRALTAASGPPQVDSATGEPHTGAMIALVPSQADLDRLPIEGGEPADLLHVTLAYLGEMADIPDEAIATLKATLESLAFSLPVLEVEAFGVAVWNKTPADRNTSVNMSVGGDMLQETHTLAWDAIETAAAGTDWVPAENHAPWVAHMCLAYSDDPAMTDLAFEREGPLTLDTLRLAIGGEAFDFPLAAAAGGDDMPYHISEDAADCDGFAVVKDGDGEVMGCHDTQADAEEQMAALYANETDAAAAEGGGISNRWHGTLLVLKEPSDDGRQFEAVTWRDLPIPLMREVKSTHGGMTSETVYVGNIDRIEIEGNAVLGWGDFDMADPEGAKSARWLAEGRFRHVSIDGGGVKQGDVEFVYPPGFDDEGMSEDGEEFAMPELTIYHNAMIMGATQVPFPAFGQAEIGVDSESPSASGDGKPTEDEASLVAAGFPVDPPAEWFKEPQFDGPQAFTIDDDGRVAGHLALWGTCHTGVQGMCRTPPMEPDYAYFETGEVVCSDGTRVPVGQITMGTGHAPAPLRQFAAAEHYDNTGSAVADVRAGTDEFGIWVAGAARPCVSGEQLRALRAATLSGDWRKFAGKLRLVAALAVNVPGFPVPRPTVASHDGDQVSLVASGVLTPEAVRRRKLSTNHRLAERIARTIGRDNASRAAAAAQRIGR